MLVKPVILLVEDDPQERETMIRAIGSDQYAVTTARNHSAALDRIDEAVDLVVSDVRPGQAAGLELLRAWQHHRPDVPFVMVAEGNDVHSAVEAMKLGATDYVTKPIHTEQLPAMIAKWLATTHTNDHRKFQNAAETPDIDIPPGTSLEDLERVAVERALELHQGNRTHAAKTLGISVRTLQRKLKAWRGPIFALHANVTAHEMYMPRH